MKKRVILFRVILAIMLSTVGLTVWAGLPDSSEAAVWGYLRGLVFDDANWNGEIDPGEGAIHDVGVRISAGDWSAFTTTGWDGTFGFAALNTGRYAVEVIIPETYSATTPVVVYRDITVGDQSVLVTGVDFGMTTALKAVGEYVPRFEQGSCPFKVSEGAVVECGFVVLPEDHSDPTGPTIRLAVAIIKDHSEEHQPDPVMLLTGGPGERPCITRLPLRESLPPSTPTAISSSSISAASACPSQHWSARSLCTRCLIFWTSRTQMSLREPSSMP